MSKSTKISENISFTFDIKNSLSRLIKEYVEEKIFILCDENSLEFAFPVIKDVFKNRTNLIKIKSGENYKNIRTVHQIWDYLFENLADRSSLLINLGGGVITDMGAFAASTYKRGIDFINIPTTLMGQVDAAIGSKTGINYSNLKNQIGNFSNAKHILIYPPFTETLSEKDFFSGTAEMIKYGLIYSEEYLENVFTQIPENFEKCNYKSFSHLIKEAAEIKLYYTKQDLKEKGIRKALNFGHTFGHAFESLSIENNDTITHGEAVSQGLICEMYLSNLKFGFELKKFLNISEKILTNFPKVKASEKDFDILINKFLIQDKKNKNNIINCTLVSEIGKPLTDINITEQEVKNSLLFYIQLSK